MNLVDIVIVLLLALSAIQGLRTGFVQCIFSFAGLIAGIAVAAWNYQRFAYQFAPVMHSYALSAAICFCLIVLAVMLAAAVLGMLIKGLIRGIGLGWLDSLLGLVFGLLRGAVLATLCIVILAAFFPDTTWLGDAQLSRYFLGSAHLTTQMTPDELKGKIKTGLSVLEQNTPNWIRPR
ncbi:MAG TPA: CvpA family protein [Acidobacteriaceae bacterium]|jgi:membrane protein required for colicin V production|nr:CvpA family protein [Acidobacteriaceae bacterium]